MLRGRADAVTVSCGGVKLAASLLSRVSCGLRRGPVPSIGAVGDRRAHDDSRKLIAGADNINGSRVIAMRTRISAVGMAAGVSRTAILYYLLAIVHESRRFA